MTSDMEGLSVRIALRTDVYDMIRHEEVSDKFESAIITCKWNNQEIMKALAKRICSYFNEPFDEELASDKSTLQYHIVQYLNCVFVSYFDKSTRVWANAPTHRVIYSLIRRKPRDMVKLCQSVAEEAYKRKLEEVNYRIAEIDALINILNRFLNSKSCLYEWHQLKKKFNQKLMNDMCILLLNYMKRLKIFSKI